MPETALFEKTKLGSINDTKPARLTIKEFQEQPAHSRLFVNNISGGAKPNYQLMYSLGDDIFLNTFSERLSMWQLSGLHIFTDCFGNEIPGEPPFLTFYKQYNIKTAQTVSMSFAGITMKGYLVDMNIGNYNQNGVEGFNFGLKYLAFLQNMSDAANNPSKAGSGTTGTNGAAGTNGATDYSSRLEAILRSASVGAYQRDPLPIVRSGLPPLGR